MQWKQSQVAGGRARGRRVLLSLYYYRILPHFLPDYRREKTILVSIIDFFLSPSTNSALCESAPSNNLARLLFFLFFFLASLKA